MIGIIGLDLDGTLLTRDKRITENNRKALEEAAERGVYIVPVTGRPYSGVPPQVMELPFILYTITSNGAVITDRRAGTVIRERCMTKDTAEKVLRAAEGEGIIREFFAKGHGFHDPITHEMLWKKHAGTPILRYLERSRIQIKDLYSSIREQEGGIENISIMCPTPEVREQLLKKIRQIEGIKVIYPLPTDLEIVSVKADKGEALLSLAGQLGLSRDEVMAMGDGNNDLGLMSAAGLSVAMGNSDKEILAAADHVTADNDHDGVAEAVRRFVL